MIRTPKTYHSYGPTYKKHEYPLTSLALISTLRRTGVAGHVANDTHSRADSHHAPPTAMTGTSGVRPHLWND